MNISVLGCGWLGLPLAIHLAANGHHIKGSTRTASKMAEMRANGIEPFIMDLRFLRTQDLQTIPFFSCDTLVLTVPPNQEHPYLDLIHKLIGVVKTLAIKKIIFMSSTGVYGDANAIVDESSMPAPNRQSATALLRAENAFRAEPSFYTSCIRLGGLIGPGRLPSPSIGNGKAIPNGLAPVNLIHLDDCIALTTLLIESNQKHLILNAVCPHHPSRQSFYTAASMTSNQPPPAFVSERTHWKIVMSKHLSPLLHYEFKVNNWFKWLARG